MRETQGRETRECFQEVLWKITWVSMFDRIGVVCSVKLRYKGSIKHVKRECLLTTIPGEAARKNEERCCGGDE